jgi:hypothetical protein
VPPSGPKPLVVELRHFEAALGRVSPSVSRRDQKLYDQMQRRLRAARGVISAEGPAAAAGTTAGGLMGWGVWGGHMEGLVGL